MACKSDVFHGRNDPNKNWTNWNGDVPFSADEYFEPADTPGIEPPDGLKQLVHVVARATSEQKPLRAIGSGWAFEDIAKSDSWVVSLNQLKRRLHHVIPAALTDKWKQQQLNGAANTQLVHVEAGMKIIDLIELLEDAGLAMPTLGGANGQNIAGAISTSTHGGDWDQPPLPDVVRAIHLVTEGGRELWIERASDPITTNERLKPVLTCPDTELVRNDSIFDAALVSCGRFGVIYSFVLEVRRAFRVVEVTTRVWDSSNPNLNDVYKALLDGMENPNNPFDRLFKLLSATPSPPGLSESTGVTQSDTPYFVQLLWASADPRDMCWVQRRWVTSERNILNPPEPNRTDGVHVAHWINFAASVHLDFVRKDQGVAVMDGAFDKSVKEGRRGPHHLLTSGTREGSESTTYTGNSIEVIFDARDDRWFQFLHTVFDAAEGKQQAGYISLRPSRASCALLSMHNVASSYAVSIEISILKGLRDNVAFMDIVHSAALKFGGRPHWGQMNRLNEQQAVDQYGQQLQNWRTALTLVSGSSKTFSNSFTRQRGLEPTSIQRKVTAVSPIKDELLVIGLREGSDKYTHEVQYSHWAQSVEHAFPDPGLTRRPVLRGPQLPESQREVSPSGPGQRRWGGWNPLKPASGLPDNFVGSATEGGKAYVFWIASDGWVNFKVRGQDGQWARLWWPVGKSNDRPWNGVPGGAVHAVSCQPGMLHVFYTDRQGGILAVLGDTSGGTTWPKSQWIHGCKTVAGGHVTAVSRRPGQVDAFVVGTDGRIYTAAWNAQENWSNWGVIKEGLTAKAGAYIAAVSRSVNLIDIFLADEDGRTMSAAWQLQDGWRGWWHIQEGLTNPNGYVTVISRSTDKLDIFTVGTDGRVYTAAWEPGGTWRGWSPINTAKAESLVWPVSRSQDKIDLFFVAPDGQVQTTSWDPGHPWDGPWTIA